MVGAFLLVASTGAWAMPAPDGNSVAILKSTTGPADPSLEKAKVLALGMTVVEMSDADWMATTSAEFATYKALVIGDPSCVGLGHPGFATAEATRATWGPAVTGNVVVVGTDPTFHSLFYAGGLPGPDGDQVAASGIAFAAAEPGETGAYITTSCLYHDTPLATPVPLLDEFGAFTAMGVGCYNDSHIVAVNPALTGLTDASLSNWSCSVHNAFDAFPSDFLPLAIAENIGGPGSLSFADGTFGVPYILARGKELSPVACGNGVLEAPEECDDGNVVNGDGCNAQCKVEVPVCGDGNVDPGEECDDGNSDNGDGCSASCEVENHDPDCSSACADPTYIWPPNHKGVPVVIGCISDPDGDPVSVTATSVYQDEKVLDAGSGSGNTSPDAQLSPLMVRAERNGNKKTPGDGRVYHISFTADDGNGGSCSGEVEVCVPHDQGGSSDCVDGGALYNSLVP